MLRVLDDERKKPFQIKATACEKQRMQELADKFANGNLSAWVRYAALNYSPSAQELSRYDDAKSKQHEEK